MSLRVLEGIRVADFGRYVAGPWCGALLADLGADVVRVERIGGGEDRFLMPVAGDEGGSIFLHVNRGKRSLTLDPSTEDGRTVVERLVKWADVVVANLPPGARRANGIDWDQVHARNPRAILATATTFGAGPYQDRLGFDGIGQAMSGAVHLTGRPGDPIKSAVPWVDFVTATQIAFGTLAALLVRERTGEGQHVDGALLRAATSVAGAHLVEQGVLGNDREAIGNRGYTGAPYDLVATKDGHVMIMVIGDKQFSRWCRLVGREDLLLDERFHNDALRASNSEALSDVLAAWCKERSTDEVLAAHESLGVPAGPVLTPRQVLDDAHVRTAGYFEWLDYPGAPAAAPIPAFPLQMSATPGKVQGRAPTIGEHTDAVLTDLGYGPDEIEALHRVGVV